MELIFFLLVWLITNNFWKALIITYLAYMFIKGK